MRTTAEPHSTVAYRNQLQRLVDMGVAQIIWRNTDGKREVRAYYRLTPLGEPLGTRPD